MIILSVVGVTGWLRSANNQGEKNTLVSACCERAGGTCFKSKSAGCSINNILGIIKRKEDMSELEIRFAEKKDVPLILGFIKELADYEKCLDQVVATEEILRESLFGGRRNAEVILAYWQNQPVGFALFFHNFSTFLGRPGLYLEDLYIVPEARGKGFGKAMMIYLAKLAKERNCGRFEWWVLDWNEPALEFYRSLGAIPMSEWTVQRVTGEALDRLAAEK
jgi:GNAT superfamily N-acetyltransferase